MRKSVLFCALALVVLCGTTAYAANPIKVDVLYMNHGPLMDTLHKMKALFSGYGPKLVLSWHDFETPEGKRFMAIKGIKGHVPLMIWIDGKSKWMVGGKPVEFSGFPTGSGPAFFRGKWTLDDLKAALNQAAAKR